MANKLVDAANHLIIFNNEPVEGLPTAAEVNVNTTNFEIITGKNAQDAFIQVDTKLALNENYDSILLSLDPLSTEISYISQVPLQSLQTQMHDGRPSHKAPGASVYDEFGTWGIIDTIEGQIANVITVVSRGSQSVTKKYVDEQVNTKQDKTSVVSVKSIAIALQNNIIYNANELETLNISVTSSTSAADFICQLNFSSGNIPTVLTLPKDIKWLGDDTETGTFIPSANARYVVIFYNDGLNLRAVTQKS